MPLQRCTAEGASGWRWGESGKCYVGPDAKAKAIAQGVAIGEGELKMARLRKRARVQPPLD